MLSLSEYRAGLCPICGNPRDICQTPTDAAAFDVPPPTRCQATTAIQIAQDEGGHERPGSLVWAAVPKQRR